MVLRKTPSKDHNTCTTFVKYLVILIYRILRAIDYTHSHYIIGEKIIYNIRIEDS